MSGYMDYIKSPIDNGFSGGVNPAPTANGPSSVRMAMYGDYADSTMEDIANDNALAQRMGVDPAFVQNNEDLKQESAAQKLEENPFFNEWIAQSERHYPFARDDFDRLNRISSVAREIMEREPGSMGNKPKEPESKYAEYWRLAQMEGGFMEGPEKATIPQVADEDIGAKIDEMILRGSVYEQEPEKNTGSVTGTYSDLADSGVLNDEDAPYESIADIQDSQNAGNSIDNSIKKVDLQFGLINRYLEKEVMKDIENNDYSRMDTHRARLLFLNGELEKMTHDNLGQYEAFEQVYRMGRYDIGYLAGGAMAGAAAGSVVPFIGTGIGAAAGVFGATYESEKLGFLNELLLETDDNGKFLDPEMIAAGAKLYGAGAGAIEASFDYLLAKMAKPIGDSLKAAWKSTGGTLTKDVIKQAIKNKSFAGTIAKFFASGAGMAATEAVQEGSQQALQSVIGNMYKRKMNEEGVNFFETNPALWTKEDTDKTLEAAGMGARVAAWMYLVPGLAKFASDNVLRAKAIKFSDGQKKLAATAADSQTKQLYPEGMEKFFQTSGLTGNGIISAQDVIALKEQHGIDIASMMGWTEESLSQAAELGEDLSIPLAKMHANMDTESITKLADVLRQDKDSMSLIDAQDIDANLNGNLDEAYERFEKDEEQRSATAIELDRIRMELTGIARNTPGLTSELRSSADLNMTPGTYVNSIMTVVGSMARRLSVLSKQDVATVLKKFKFRGVMDAMRVKEQLAEMGMDKSKKLIHLRKIVDPDMVAAWGKVSRSEFVKQFGKQRAKRFDELYGPKFWAKKGEGTSPDKVAISAPEWHSDERFGRRAPDEQVDMNEFWDGLERTNEEVLGSNDVDTVLNSFGFAGDEVMQSVTDALFQAQEANQTFGQHLLGVHSMEFKSRLKDALKNPIKKRIKLLPRTPLVLDMIFEGDLPQDGVTVSAHAQYETSEKGKHPEVTSEVWMQVPEAIAHPVAIFDPSTESENFVSNVEKGDVVFLLELKDKEGNAKPFVAYVSTKSKGNEGKTINMVKTCCSTTQSWIDDQFKKHNTPRYIDEGHRWLGASVHTVHSGHAGLQAKGQKRTNAHGNRVWSKSDFVKKQKRNKNVYQNKERGSNPLGATYNTENGDYVIEVFKGANVSTILHELGHVFTQEMQMLEKMGMADPQLKADIQALMNWTDALKKPEVLKKEYNQYQKNSLFAGREFETLTAEEKQKVLDRGRQEWFARGFEQYLREGTTPSTKLQPIFKRFKKWLERVYREVKNLNVQLTDEVRSVFDRMLAAEEEMDVAAINNGLWTEAKQWMDDIGLKGKERLRIESLIADAKSNAADALRKARNTQNEKRIQQWKEEAAQEIENSLVYQARRQIKRTPLNRIDVVNLIGEEQAEELERILPYSLSKNGVPLDAFVANRTEFESPEAMLRGLLNSKSISAFVQDFVDERQAAYDQTFNPEESLYEQPEISAIQDELAVALVAKVTGILKKADEKAKYEKEVKGDTVLGQDVSLSNMSKYQATREILRAKAEEKLQNMPMSEQIKPEGYRKRAGYFMQKEREAIMRKNYAKALEFNYLARINLECGKLAVERGNMVEKLRRDMKQAMGSKDISGGIRIGAYLLSQRYRLHKDYELSEKAKRAMSDYTLDDFKKQMDVLQDEGFLTSGTFDSGAFGLSNDAAGITPMTARNWQDMHWKEFERVFQAARQMILAERMRVYKDKKTTKETREAVGKAIAKEILDEWASFGGKLKPNAIDEVKSKMRKRLENWKDYGVYGGLNLDTMISMLSGDKDGVLYKTIMEPINKATWKRAEILEGMHTKWKGLIGRYSSKEQRAMTQEHSFTVEDGVVFKTTRLKSIMMLLNMGNAENLDRLEKSGMTQERRNVALSILEKKDFEFAQEVWDYFDTFRKESFDIEERLTGLRPKRVLPTPLQTPFGKLRGGYFPIRYDGDASVYVPGADGKEIGSVSNVMIPASVNHGFMKDRQSSGQEGKALKLDDIMVIQQHLATVAHMLAFREPIHEIAAILRNKDVTRAIEKTMGAPVMKAMIGSIKYIAGERPASSGAAKFIGSLRKKSAIFTMGYALCTTLVQTFGFLTAMPEIGVWPVLKGLGYSIGRGGKDLVKTGMGWFGIKGLQNGMWQEVCEKSVMMRNRIDSIDREMFEVGNDMNFGATFGVSDFARMKHKMQKHAFKMIGWAQMVTSDMPVWMASYHKALNENKTEQEAIAYADRVVERTQVGGAEKNLSRWQQGNEVMKALTMFYSYFGCLYNLSLRLGTKASRTHNIHDVMRFATLALPMFMEPIITGVLTRKDPDSDDWGERFKWAIGEMIMNPFNMIPVVRDVVSFISNKMDYNFATFRPTPLGDVVTNGDKAVEEIFKVLKDDAKADTRKMIGATMKALGPITGNPLFSVQAYKTFDTMAGFYLDDPDASIFNLIRKRKKDNK